MYLGELIPPTEVFQVVNPRASTYDKRRATDTEIRGAAQWAVDAVTQITHIPTPEDFEQQPVGHRVTESLGGDTTVNNTLSALIGYIPNSPTADGTGTETHSKNLQQTTYIPLAHGNASNVPLSALGKYSKRPELLTVAKDLVVSQHHLLEYAVYDTDGQLRRSGIVTSCIGIATSADILWQLKQQEQQLQNVTRKRRLGHEILVTLQTLWHAKPFSGMLYYSDGSLGTEITDSQLPPKDNRVHSSSFTDLTAIELINSRRYAKVGRTRTNVDNAHQQEILNIYEPVPTKRAAKLVRTIAQILTGRYSKPPQDFTNSRWWLTITGDQPVRYHIDGETGEDFMLHPGDTLTLHALQITVPTLMRERYTAQNLNKQRGGRHTASRKRPQ